MLWCSRVVWALAVFPLGWLSFETIQSVDAKKRPPKEAAVATPVAVPGTAAHPAALPFLENDFPTAKKRAQERKQWLFAEAWAPWCHTCLSMRNFVFPDPVLAPLADRMVYLAVDTENPTNREFLANFPVSVWPTLLVIAPGEAGKSEAADTVVARFEGALSAPKLFASLSALLAKEDPGQTQLVAAEHLLSLGKTAQAAQAFAALVAEPKSGAQALVGWVKSLGRLGDFETCVAVHERHFAQAGKTALATDFASYVARCVAQIPDVDRRHKLARQLRQDLEKLVLDRAADLSVDDRSDGYGTMIELSDAMGDKQMGDEITLQRLALLERAAGAAKTPTESATFDAHRFDGYRRLRRWPVALEMLLGTEKALPDDYNVKARLARLHYETGEFELALAKIEQALALAAGPRRANLFELRAAIQSGQGQLRAALDSLRAAKAIVAASGVSKRGKDLEEQIARLEKQVPAPPTVPGPQFAVPATQPAVPATQLATETQRGKPTGKPSRRLAKRNAGSMK